MKNYIVTYSSAHVIHRIRPKSSAQMQHTPDASQPPQASASTNSATRAVASVVDGVSQENRPVSSDHDAGDKFSAREIREHIPTGSVRNDNARVCLTNP